MFELSCVVNHSVKQDVVNYQTMSGLVSECLIFIIILVFIFIFIFVAPHT